MNKKNDNIGVKDAEISQCSTSAITPMSHSSSQQNVRRTGVVTRSQRALYFQIAIQGLFTTGTFITLLIIIVPIPILLTFSIFLVSFLHLIYICFSSLWEKYTQIVQENGIGQYIPSSLYNMLTETTLHETMQDNSFVEEYQYLMLYLIPFISEEQLETHVNNLSSRQRNQLRRHGLGHLLGEGFMRALMGESRYRRSSNELLPPPISMDPSPVIDIDSISLDSYASANNIQISGSTEEEDDEQPRTISIPEDTREQQDHETNVLSNALSDMTNNYMRMSREIVSSGIVRLTDSVTQYMINGGLMVTAVSTGVGLFGLWHDVYSSRERIALTTDRIGSLPSSRSFLSMAVSGGITTGMMILCRQGVRWSLSGRYQSKSNGKSNKGEKD
mmetsp:Transcript_27522/g.31393  ORF Transcript_27522/g.31393 Transcript_27522/m.31393 type:complete len:388 (-) Transcript_27522:39-1202(-)